MQSLGGQRAPGARFVFNNHRLAQNAPGQVWTPVYIDFNAKDLVMTRARSVQSRQGEQDGVVATDVFLNSLRGWVAAELV